MIVTDPIGAKKILIMNWRDPKHPEAGGAERYLFEVARRFVLGGHSVHWLTAGFRGAVPSETIDGIEITRVGSRVSVYARLPWHYVRHLRNRFDFIVDAENGIPFFSPLFTTRRKVCLIFHVHQRVFEKHLPFPISSVFRWIEAVAMPIAYRASRFVAISDDTRRELVDIGVPSERIDLAYSGYDARLVPGPKTPEPSMVYVGRLKKYKRIDVVLRAFASVRERVPSATLTIAGSGDQEHELRILAETLGIARAVRFEGFVDEARKRDLLAGSWIFVMASEMEGWGLTIVEAAACGTPTVAVSVPGVREAVVHGRSGILVDDCSHLAPALAELLVDPERRERLGRGALERAESFSWDRTADSILGALASS